MYTIEYDIQLNEAGRPYVELPDDYENQPEDRFFSIEMTRYILQDLIYRRSTELDENTNKHLDNTINLLGQVSDEMAEILFGEMRRMADVEIMLNPKYHIQIESIEDRNALPEKFIYYNNKIFDRIVGLRVLVTKEMKIYELTEGITNENWKEI